MGILQTKHMVSTTDKETARHTWVHQTLQDMLLQCRTPTLYHKSD